MAYGSPASSAASGTSSSKPEQDASPDLWQRWCGERDETAREALISHYLYYARTLAAMAYARRTHGDILFEEYLQLASIGLIEAVDRFDPAFGVLFRTFAGKRIHGAILNGLPRLTEKNQQIAVRARLRQERLESIKEGAGTPSDDRVGDGQRGDRPPSAEALFRYLADVGVGLALGVLLEGSGMVDSEAFGSGAQAASPEVSYFRQTEIRQLQQAIREIVARLTPQQQQVIRSHYLQEIPFEEIARSMGLTRGRISQVHKQALLKLRELLAHDSRCDVSG